MCVGPRIGLDTLLANLMSKNDLTSTFLGPGPGEEQEGKFLGRSICWRTYGLTWTGDVKLLNEALLVWDMSTSFGLETPGLIVECDVSSHEIAEFMSKEEAAKCRRTAAKLNYLSLDNPMIAFASKEASRSMSSHKQGEEIKLKRILRFLRKRPTTTYRYEWQDHPGELTGSSDSDWAGCKLTRRCTSARVIMHGSHLLLHYVHGLKLVSPSRALRPN